MVRRRTRAIVEFSIAALSLLVQIRLWRSLLNDREERDEPTPVSLTGLALGALYGGSYLWIHDRDVGEIRTNSRHGLLFSVCAMGIRRRFLPRTTEYRRNFGVGQLVGMVAYRFWFGLLRALPGTDE